MPLGPRVGTTAPAPTPTPLHPHTPSTRAPLGATPLAATAIRPVT